jgi:hypothetical protein
MTKHIESQAETVERVAGENGWAVTVDQQSYTRPAIRFSRRGTFLAVAFSPDTGEALWARCNRTTLPAGQPGITRLLTILMRPV